MELALGSPSELVPPSLWHTFSVGLPLFPIALSIGTPRLLYTNFPRETPTPFL